MRKMSKTRFIAAAALAGSAGLAVVAPVAIGGAATVKPPVRVSCTGLFGQSDASTGVGAQLLSGCTGSSTKAHVTSFGVEVPGGGTIPTTATITWTNKDTTTIGLSGLTTTTNDCSSYIGVAASFKEQVTSTVTGGNSKLTVGDANTGTACVYISGNQVLIIGGASTL